MNDITPGFADSAAPGWARTLLIFALLAALLLLSGPLGYRAGVIPLMAGVLLPVGAVVVSGIVLLGALISIRALVKPERRRARVPVALATTLSLAVVIVVGGPVLSGSSAPPIHDISTDLSNPPKFVALVPLRAAVQANSLDYTADTAAQTRAAYGDLGPLDVNLAPPDAFQKVLQVANQLGWMVVARAPQEGRIEATASTFWYGFKDDVVVRIVPQAAGSRLDVRSVSRVGRSDLGVNANRIRTFQAAFAAP